MALLRQHAIGTRYLSLNFPSFFFILNKIPSKLVPKLSMGGSVTSRFAFPFKINRLILIEKIRRNSSLVTIFDKHVCTEIQEQFWIINNDSIIRWTVRIEPWRIDSDFYRYRGALWGKFCLGRFADSIKRVSINYTFARFATAISVIIYLPLPR